ncbi:MAG: SMC-Scp complex subunit ScpB [Actinomycetota bacterium]|nr:SMC-Scp complex subunit ScpB [Actinomycetota bacterium]
MDDSPLKQIIEAVLFVADEPVATADLAVLLEVPASDIESELIELGADYDKNRRGIVLRNIAGGWRLTTHPDAAGFLERFISENRSSRMSQAALETLSIIAYRQPVSRGQIAEIRGVSSEGVLRTLLLRGVIEEVGRDEGPGQAILYGTTTTFLERMGLASLADLPSLPQFMPDTQEVERMESGLGPGI